MGSNAKKNLPVKLGERNLTKPNMNYREWTEIRKFSSQTFQAVFNSTKTQIKKRFLTQGRVVKRKQPSRARRATYVFERNVLRLSSQDPRRTATANLGLVSSTLELSPSLHTTYQTSITAWGIAWKVECKKSHSSSRGIDGLKLHEHILSLAEHLRCDLGNFGRMNRSKCCF